MKNIVIYICIFYYGAICSAITPEEKFVKTYYENWMKWDFKSLVEMHHPEFFIELGKYSDLKRETYHKKYEESVKKYKSVKDFKLENDFKYKDFVIAHRDKKVSICYFHFWGISGGQKGNVKMVFILKKDGNKLKLIKDEFYKNSDYKIEDLQKMFKK